MSLTISSFLLINGEVISTTEASVPWLSSGAKIGWGIFETLRARAGRIELLEKHHHRLIRSCQELDLPAPDFSQFSDQLYKILEINELLKKDARLRWTILAQSPSNTIIHQIAEAEFFHPYHSTAKIGILPGAISSKAPLAAHKSISYATHAWGLAQAKKLGLDEGIWLNENGHLCEGCTSNLFFLRNGALHTPSLDCGILPGVMRERVLELAQDLGLPIHQGFYTVQDLEQAEEVFLTSSLRGIQCVTHFQGANNSHHWNQFPIANQLKLCLETSQTL